MVDRAGQGKTVGIGKGVLGLEFGGLKSKRINLFSLFACPQAVPRKAKVRREGILGVADGIIGMGYNVNPSRPYSNI